MRRTWQLAIGQPQVPDGKPGSGYRVPEREAGSGKRSCQSPIANCHPDASDPSRVRPPPQLSAGMRAGLGTGWKWVQQYSFLLYDDRRVVHPS
jgi:hypothetical protein